MSTTFNKLYVMPQRKLRAQQMLERLTGRAPEPLQSQRDIEFRMALRQPRQEEMSTKQDWPSVWPAAASFKSSVVPLPVRMGSRRHPERRPPFKTVGNLELVKIPNFLHLTPEHIRRHCEAIKKFCTEFPPELKADPSLMDKYLPLKVSYSDYVHQGTNIRDMRSRVVNLSVKRSALGLDEHGNVKLQRLAGHRYNPKSDELTITTDRCPTRQQNRDYAHFLLIALYHESKKEEAWEKGWKESWDREVRLAKMLPSK